MLLLEKCSVFSQEQNILRAPLGFHVAASLWFDSVTEFPHASTFALQQILPTKFFDSPERFTEKMVYGLKNHGGFGML